MQLSQTQCPHGIIAVSGGVSIQTGQILVAGNADSCVFDAAAAARRTGRSQRTYRRLLGGG